MIIRYTYRVDKDDVWVADFPQHLLNASLKTSSSTYEHVTHHLMYTSESFFFSQRCAESYLYNVHIT